MPISLNFILHRFLLCSMGCMAMFHVALSQPARIVNFGVKDGLPQATVTCILQDRDGYIWAGTKDGLTRSNGYQFTVVRYQPDDSTSLSSSNITALAQDLSGNIWVGTAFGLNLLDPVTLKSRQYYHWFGNDKSLSSSKITAIVCDLSGNVWVGTENGLNKLEDLRGSFSIFSIRDNEPLSLTGNRINALLVDRNNQLWVGTEYGLNRAGAHGQFVRFKSKFNDDNSLSNNAVLSLAEDAEGNVWIGTRNGLNRLHPVSDTFTRFFSNAPLRELLSSNIINTLLVDFRGRLWVGTPSGLHQLLVTQQGASREVSSSVSYPEIPSKHITCLHADRSGLVWAGTLSAGLVTVNDDAQRFYGSRSDPRTGQEPEWNKVHSFMRFGPNALLVGTGAGVLCYSTHKAASEFRGGWGEGEIWLPVDGAVRDMAFGPDSILWMATDGQGLLAVDRKKAKVIRRHIAVPGDKDGLPVNRLSCIIPADSGNFWIGTLGGGFCYFNTSTETFRTYRFSAGQAQPLRDNNVWCMAQQDANHLWVGTGNGGLYLFNPTAEQFVSISAADRLQGDLGSTIINDIHVDKDKSIWVATSGGGLSMLPRNGGSFVKYMEEQGLASNVVLTVQCDFDGNIWMSTNGGISVLQPETGLVINYNEQDIPGYNTFYPSSGCSDNESRMYFGGANGMNYFYAEGIRQNRFIPPVVISNFGLLASTDDTGLVEDWNTAADTINLRFNHPGFTLEFAALNFKQPEKNQYKYRMLGLFDQWRSLGNRRFATFSTLAPGTYTFEVIGSNNDGYWNDTPARLTFIVKPAFWQTGPFRIALAFLLLSGLYMFYLYRIRQEQIRRVILEKAVRERTQEIAKERDANAVLLREVHHRVKNNLQIIVSLLSLQSRFITDRKLTQVFDEVQNRVRSMSLIHQKMYQSKDLSSVNIAEYISDLSSNLLNTYKLSQKVKLEINIAVNRFKSDTLTPLGLIINEIISNALKYAFEEDTEGTIFVEIKALSEGRYRMLIGDDGVGMSADIAPGGGGSFGTELIEALTEQLNGTINRLPDRKGTVYQIDFEDLEE